MVILPLLALPIELQPCRPTSGHVGLAKLCEYNIDRQPPCGELVAIQSIKKRLHILAIEGPGWEEHFSVSADVIDLAGFESGVRSPHCAVAVLLGGCVWIFALNENRVACLDALRHDVCVDHLLDLSSQVEEGREHRQAAICAGHALADAMDDARHTVLVVPRDKIPGFFIATIDAEPTRWAYPNAGWCAV